MPLVVSGRVPAIDAGGQFVGFRENIGWQPPALLPPQIEAARGALEGYQAVLEPAGPDFIRIRIDALLGHWRHRDGDERQETMRVIAGDWLRALSAYPAWAIAKAADEWIDTSKYRPTIAEIRALCEAAVREDRLTLRLLRRLVDQNGSGSISRTT